MEKVEGKDGAPIWLFSTETVSILEQASENDYRTIIERLLPPFLGRLPIAGVSVGQWLAMLVLLVLSYLVAWGITELILFVLRRVWKKAATQPTAGITRAFALPVRLYLAMFLFKEASREIGISIVVRQWFSSITIVVGLIAILLLLWRLTQFISTFSRDRLSAKGHVSGVSVVLFVRRLALIAIVVFGFIAILGIFGFDVTTGLAALGIGGIALALGAQKTVENFVGSVTLIADQPIRVGDFCKIGETIGTVEEIGMRATRVRTLDRTVVSIPNGELSSVRIENFAHRDRFRMYAVWGFRYETTADQLRYLLVELRSVLYAHPKVDPDPARVRFTEYGNASLNIEIFAYILAKEFNEFTEIREDIMLRMMDVVEASGTSFAFPSQTIYMAKDEGLSEEKSRQAEEKVRQWKQTGEMQLPTFSEDKKAQLQNTIQYPPSGSAGQRGI
jgi:MscS family membrane protein